VRESIQKSVCEAIKAISFLEKQESIDFIELAQKLICLSYRKQKKILICGNGGSLCDAMHFAEELTGQFRKKRKAFPAIALSDPGHMSCVANDMGFNEVFARGVEALGQEDDVLILLSTSGNSENLVRALEVAKEKKLKTIAFLGKTGGRLKGLADLEWIIEGFATSDRIQEVHMAAIHILIEMIEYELVYPNEVLKKMTASI